MKKITAALGAFALLISLGQATLAAPLKNGEKAPDFTLTDAQGKEHTLSNYQGKHVVLEWINHDCPFVKKHYDSGNMQVLQSRYADGEKVVWFSVVSSAKGKQGHLSPKQWQKISKEKKSAATAVLIDENGVVGRSYAAKTTPHIYIINPEGNLIYQGAIDSNPSANKDDIPDSVNYVSKTLDAALAGEPLEAYSTKPYGCSVKY